MLTGRLKSNHRVHKIVAIDDRDDKPGGYWVKGYVTQLDSDSSFSISIPRPKKCSGKIKLLVVYENGTFTGNGKKRGIDSATIIPYKFR